MRFLLSSYGVLWILGSFLCSLTSAAAVADERVDATLKNRATIQVSPQRSRSLDREARRAQSRALTAMSYAMLEKYALGKSKPSEWQSLVSAELADSWEVTGEARRLEDQWILGGKEEVVVRFKVAPRQVVILAAEVQCEKSKEPFSQPKMTIWFRNRTSQRVQQSTFSLEESANPANKQMLQILIRYDEATQRTCTAQIANEDSRSAGNFSQQPMDIIAIGFTVPAGSKLKVQRLDMHRVASSAGVDSALQVK